MERFKRFFEKTIKFEKLKDSKFLESFSIKSKYVPEKLEEFDEMEFLINDIVMNIVVFKDKISRIMFVKVDKENPDNYFPLSKEELDKFLNEYGEKLIKFFENITE